MIGRIWERRKLVTTNCHVDWGSELASKKGYLCFGDQ